MKKEILGIPLTAIKGDPGQPRKDFDMSDLGELAQSIKKNGLLSPITVKRETRGKGEYTGKYIIVAGERRFRAHELLGTETIDCIVYNGTNGRELQLVENINRKDLNSMEVVNAYQAYLDDGHTIEELSQVVGKPKNTIAWLMNLQNCREDVQHLVGRKQISLVVAVGLSKLTENGQMTALRTIQANDLNVAECQAVCTKVFMAENQTEMFAEEVKLSDNEIQARHKIQNSLDRACQALQEINKMELDNPGISAQAIAEKLDITQEKVDMLYKLIGQFKSNLRQKRVGALC